MNRILQALWWYFLRPYNKLMNTFVNFNRLEVSSERNDRKMYPNGSYVEIEHHLLKLALVCLLSRWIINNYYYLL